MVLFRKKKKPECEHDWFELDTCVERIDVSLGYYPDFGDVEFMYVYCPKCDLKKRVKLPEGKRIIKANDIKKNYKAN